MKKFWTKKSSDDLEVKCCKKCECELMSDNLSGYCANCKKEKGISIRNNALKVAGFCMAIFVGSKYKGGGSGKS